MGRQTHVCNNQWSPREAREQRLWRTTSYLDSVGPTDQACHSLRNCLRAGSKQPMQSKDKTLKIAGSKENMKSFFPYTFLIKHELQLTLETVILEFHSPKHTFFNYSLVDFPIFKINFRTFPFLITLAVFLIYKLPTKSPCSAFFS